MSAGRQTADAADVAVGLGVGLKRSMDHVEISTSSSKMLKTSRDNISDIPLCSTSAQSSVPAPPRSPDSTSSIEGASPAVSTLSGPAPSNPVLYFTGLGPAASNMFTARQTQDRPITRITRGTVARTLSGQGRIRATSFTRPPSSLVTGSPAAKPSSGDLSPRGSKAPILDMSICSTPRVEELLPRLSAQSSYLAPASRGDMSAGTQSAMTQSWPVSSAAEPQNRPTGDLWPAQVQSDAAGHGDKRLRLPPEMEPPSRSERGSGASTFLERLRGPQPSRSSAVCSSLRNFLQVYGSDPMWMDVCMGKAAGPCSEGGNVARGLAGDLHIETKSGSAQTCGRPLSSGSAVFYGRGGDWRDVDDGFEERRCEGHQCTSRLPSQNVRARLPDVTALPTAQGRQGPYPWLLHSDASTSNVARSAGSTCGTKCRSLPPNTDLDWPCRSAEMPSNEVSTTRGTVQMQAGAAYCAGICPPATSEKPPGSGQDSGLDSAGVTVQRETVTLPTERCTTTATLMRTTTPSSLPASNVDGSIQQAAVAASRAGSDGVSIYLAVSSEASISHGPSAPPATATCGPGKAVREQQSADCGGSGSGSFIAHVSDTADAAGWMPCTGSSAHTGCCYRGVRKDDTSTELAGLAGLHNDPLVEYLCAMDEDVFRTDNDEEDGDYDDDDGDGKGGDVHVAVDSLGPVHMMEDDSGGNDSDLLMELFDSDDEMA